MRTIHLAACAAAVLLTNGAIAAGCISNDGTEPPALGNDGGGYDANLPGADTGPSPGLDGGGPSDAGIDAPATGTLGTTTIDFGLVSCGSGTGSQTYTFKNTGSVEIDYAASITGGTVFSIDGVSSGSVAPGATGTITLDVGSIPTTSTAGTPITGTLTLSTNVAGLSSVQVPLTVTPQGASLTVSPALAGFGQVQLATDGTPIPLTVTNTGNAPVTITFGTPAAPDGGAADTEFGVTYAGSPAGATLAPGGSLPDAGATFHPTTSGVKSVLAAIQTTDPLCASSASAVALSGTGTAAQVTVGPDPLAFGTVSCGKSGTALTVTLKNSSPAPVAFTDALKLATASPYTLSVALGSIPGGTVANPGIATITVTPKAITAPASVTAGAFNDTLTVTPTAPGLTATTIALQESASGAILAVSMPTTAFGTVETNGSLPFTVTNTGNVAAPLTASVTGTGYSAGTFTPSATVAAGGTATGSVVFTTSNNASDPGTLKVTTTAPLCSATPAAINLTATSETPPSAGFSAATVPLTATCGAGAGSAGSLVVSNSGGAALTITSVTSASGHFTAVAPGAIASGSSGTIALTAAAIAVGAGAYGGTTLNDTLTFTTNELSNNTHTVPVAVAVTGANLAYSTTNPLSTMCNDVTYSVVNTGNADGYVVATGTYPSDPDSANNGADVFSFGGAFSKSTLIPVGGAAVSDTFGRGSVCGIHVPCDFTGTQTFSTTDAAGSQSGICMPLPTLDMAIDVSTTETCEDTCC